MHYFDYSISPDLFNNDKNSIILSQKDADVLNSVLLLFGKDKTIIARESNGDLYAYSDTDPLSKVKLKSDLLPDIPRNKYVDVRDALRRKQASRI